MTWRLDALHKLGVYALVAIAVLALWLGQALNPLVVVAFTVGGILSWFCDRPRIDPAQYAGIWRPLTLGVLGILIALAITGLVGPFDAAIGLVLYLTAAKLFQRERVADYVQTMVLSFLMMAIATVFNEDISFGLLFIAYTIIGLISFALYHLRIQVEEHPQAAVQTRLVDRAFLTNLTGLALIALAGSIAFFFLFPRIGFGFLAQQSRATGMSTGFSEEVRLGDFGTLKSDPTVVMRVEFPLGSPERPQNLYWKGVSFDQYDGFVWSRTLTDTQSLSADGNSRFSLPNNALAPAWQALRADPAAPRLVQSIFLDPIDTNALFHLDPWIDLQLANRNSANRPNRFRNSSLGLAETGDISHRLTQRIAYQYEVTSLVPPRQASLFQQVDHETILASLGSQASAYLQLPDNFNPQIRDLAEDWSRTASTDFGRAQAIQDTLASTFDYTVNLFDPGDQAPLDAFLFTHQEGHCEYFSTAMAIMLRSIGIPARNVTGFIGGSWNQGQGYLSVRNADAHSWVEVPFGEYGWVRFDPTPAAANVSLQRDWWDPVRQAYDALRFQWIKYVIQYDLETQVELLQELTETLGQMGQRQGEQANWGDQLRAWIPTLRASLQQNAIPLIGLTLVTVIGGSRGKQRRYRQIQPQDYLVVLVLSGVGGSLMGVLWQPQSSLGLVLVGLLLPGFAFAGMRWVNPATPSSQQRVAAITHLYTQLRLTMRQVGIPVVSSPGALIEELHRSSLRDPQRAIRLIERYMAVRFGGDPIDPAELKLLWQKLRELRRQWHQNPSPPVTAQP